MKTMARESRLKFDEYDLSAVYTKAQNPRACLVFGHGAGAGYRHGTLENISAAFGEVGISMYRFNFPYMEAGKNRVDSNAVASATFNAALKLATRRYGGPFYLGGHSFGGRMASHAVVEHGLDVAGLIFCSFPLHNPAKPSLDRAEHMDAISCPMLFLSGTRDGMAEKKLMTRLVRRLKGELKWLDTADHGYKVLKRTRQRTDDVFAEMAEHASEFVTRTA